MRFPTIGTGNIVQNFQKISVFASALLVIVASGCRSVGKSPFAYKASEPQAVVATSESAAKNAASVGVVQATGNDPVSQQIAAESKMLSGGLPVASDPELAKYANLPEDPNTYRSSSERSAGSFTPGSSRSSGCTSGCCK